MSSLKETLQPLYDETVTHILPKKICDGTLDDAVLYVYLDQDLKYFEVGMRLFAKALSLCDKMSSMVTLAKQIGFIANDENDYFVRCLEELRPAASQSVPLMVKNSPTLPQVSEYIDYVEELLHSDSYSELITALYMMEKVYLDWTVYNPVKPDLPYKYAEWINLHTGDAFTAWVQFLEQEAERTKGPLSNETAAKVVRLEYAFFDACYNYQE